MDYTTQLSALLNHAIDEVVESVAIEGLQALKHTLDSAGFGEFDTLKNYEVFSHVEGREITFEIKVEFESLDEKTKETLLSQSTSQDQKIRRTAKTFAFSGIGGAVNSVSRMHDARHVTHDARWKGHDARKTVREVPDTRKGSGERLAGHGLAFHAPRGISIDKMGKLSVSLEKTVKETDRGVTFPQGDFQGILGKFIDKLKMVVSDKFVPQLELIIRRNFE